MSLYDYEESKKIAKEGVSFESLIMAAAWKADTLKFGKLKSAFPEIIDEFANRYFQGGVCHEDKSEDENNIRTKKNK
jgi:hypothetical protein